MKISLLSNLFSGSIINSPTRLDKLARKTKWLIRKPKKLKPIHFVHGLLQALLNCDCSFRLLASSIGMRLDEMPVPSGAAGNTFPTISKTGLWKRVGPEAVEFVKSILAEMMKERMHTSGYAIPAIPTIGRIIVEDSAILNIDVRHVEQFPATSNQHASGAGLRFQAAFDLISGEPIRVDLTKYKRVDRAASGDIIPLLREGDLLIRDLGYFGISSFQSIAEKGAHYLSRHLGACVLHHSAEDGGERINLLKLLQDRAPNPGASVDIDVVLGSGQKGVARTHCRLTARRVPLAVEEKRLRRLGQDEKRLGIKFTKVHRKLQSWEIYITSLPRKEVPAEKVFELYPLRWRIEIIFKACKSYTGVGKIAAHESNANHVQVMLYSWLCLLVMASRTRAFALAVEQGGGLRANYLSLLKVMPKVFELLKMLMIASSAPATQLLDRLACQINYHDRYEHRKTRRNMAKMLEETLGLLTAGAGVAIEI